MLNSSLFISATKVIDFTITVLHDQKSGRSYFIQLRSLLKTSMDA